MTLRETIFKILQGTTQEALAERLGLDPGVGQQTVSNMLNSTENSTWEKHWKLFWKLVPICIELHLIEKSNLRAEKHATPQSNNDKPKRGRRRYIMSTSANSIKISA